MGMEQEPQILVFQEQEVEDEETVSLLRKSSGKTKNYGDLGADKAANGALNSNSNRSSSSDSEYSNGCEAENQEGEQNGFGTGEEKDAKKEENESMQSHSVYLDKDQGSGNVEGSNPKEHDVFEISVDETNIDGEISAATKKYENQGYQGSEIGPNYVMTKEEEKGSDLRSESFEKLHQEEITNNGSTVKDKNDEIEEIDEEATEYDVETVINKQNTHDLFCPNCQSCITKKVILRRKRRVKNLRTKSRRGKVDKGPVPDLADGLSKPSDTQPKLDDSPAYTSNTRPKLEDSPLLGEDKKNEYNDQEAFRCLSCFSYFIPTGNGFKLFRCFGDDNEKYSLINPQETHEPSKPWLISLFASRRNTKISEEGNAGHYHSNADGVKHTTLSTDQRSDTPLPIAPHTAPSNITDLIEVNHTKPDKNASDSQKGSAEGYPLAGESKSHNVPAEGSPLAGKLQWGTNEKPDIENGDIKLDQKNGTRPSIGESSLNQSSSPGKASVNGFEDTKKGAVRSSTEEQIVFNSVLNGAAKKPDNAVWKTSPGTNELHVNNSNTSSLATNQQPTISTSSGMLTESDILQSQNIGIASIFSSEKGDMVLEKVKTNFKDKPDDAIEKLTTGDHAITIKEVNSVREATAQGAQVVPAEAENLLESRIQRDTKQFEIMKSVVYGGLMESITSVGVVSSAVGAHTSTLNVFALGVANLVGGLFVIIYNLVELKKGQHTEDATRLSEREEDRYRELIGQRQNFPLHITIAVLSYLLFGSLPPVIYGFSFRKNDNTDLKLAAVACASLLCIAILASAKAHVRRPPKTYFKTIMQFVIIGISASGISYLAGRLIDRLMEKLGWFNLDPSLSVSSPRTMTANSGWAYY